MARKKKKKSTATPLSERFTEVGGARLILAIALIGSTAFVLTFGVSKLEARTQSLMATNDVTFAWPVVRSIPGEDGPTAWPPRDVQQRLLAMARDRVRQYPDPLSRQTLAAIGTDMLATGLFEEVRAVRRRPGGVIEIQGAWRRPTAAVRHDGHDQLIGPGAEVMPVRLSAGQRSIRVILGVAFNPPTRSDGTPAYAEAWPGEDVQAGLLVLEQLRDRAYWHQVKAIDVSGHLRSQRVEIITDRGSRVVWGAAPGTFKPGEVGTERKLQHLQALFERYGRIDAGQNRVTVFYEYTDVDRSASSGT